MIKNSLISLIGAQTLVNAILWIVALTMFPRTSPAAILHYSVGVGIDFIGEGRQIMVLPAAGTVVLVLNGILAYGVRRMSRPAVWIMLGGSAVVQLLLIAAYVYLLKLNS